MHPQDVAQHLSVSVQVLRDAVAGQQGSPIDDITLNGVCLRTRFAVETLQSQAVPRGVAVAVAPGMLQQATMNIPILGTRQREIRVLMMDCEDWDSQPPTATLELANGSPLARETSCVNPVCGWRLSACRQALRARACGPPCG